MSDWADSYDDWEDAEEWEDEGLEALGLDPIEQFELERSLSGDWGAEAQEGAEAWCAENGVQLEWADPEEGAAIEQFESELAVDTARFRGEGERAEKALGRRLTEAEIKEISDDAAARGVIPDVLQEHGY